MLHSVAIAALQQTHVVEALTLSRPHNGQWRNQGRAVVRRGLWHPPPLMCRKNVFFNHQSARTFGVCPRTPTRRTPLTPSLSRCWTRPWSAIRHQHSFDRGNPISWSELCRHFAPDKKIRGRRPGWFPVTLFATPMYVIRVSSEIAHISPETGARKSDKAKPEKDPFRKKVVRIFRDLSEHQAASCEP